MNKLFSLLKRVPKRTAAGIVMIALAVIIPSTLYAYGPNRTTFTGAHPAPYVMFDSITDNPDVGDERNFVRIKDASDTSAYTDNVNVQAGHTYDVMVYYHNDASTSLDPSGAGIAHDVTLRMQMAADAAANSSTQVSGFIDWSKTSPNPQNIYEVYDSATITNQTAAAMDLSFVAGSAKVTSNGAVNGATLPNSVFSTGTDLGYSGLDGTIPGCNQYAGYVIFQVKANQPNFTVTKQVRKVGETTWNKTEAVSPGDKVQYLISYQNTGTETQSNVDLKDILPAGETYVSGTTYVANTSNPSGLLLDAKSDTATTTGVNIGTYNPGGNAYIMLTAQVASNDALSVCGPNTLTNEAEINTQNGTKTDTATVTVNKTCTTTPVYTCNALTATLTSGTTYNFNGSASASNGASIVGYSINFGDGNSSPLSSTTTNILHTYATGSTGTTYTATLNVTFDVNGTHTTVSGADCAVLITVGSTPECQPGIPVGDSRCTTPPLLPHTGASADIATFLGLGALVASVIYYVRSRRALV